MQIKNDRFRTAALAGIVCLGLGACLPDFDKGDFLEARVGRVAGDPCRVMITLTGQRSSGLPKGLIARLETSECMGAAK